MDRKTDSEPTEGVSGADGASCPLSHSETARALRTFIYTRGMWGACAFQLAFSAAPLLGSALARAFEPVHLEWFKFPVGNLLVPNLLLRPVEDARGTTPRQLLAQVGRGNLLSYVYGSLVYDRASSTLIRTRPG